MVDDNPFNLLVTERLLKNLDYLVLTAIGGNEAISLLKSSDLEPNAIKYILMDCNMPVLDGYDTSRILNNMMDRGEIPKIPIFALTANNNEEDIEKCYEYGMNDYLTKPTTQQTLLAAFAKYEEKSQE